tara:strand:+ start:63 stop:851 length:789 start_codon:yes stop_codon:yes gene_type:complete
MKKICYSCKEEKLVTEFYVNRSTKDQRTSVCKKCLYERNKKSRKLFYLKNKERLLKKQNDYYKDHKEERMQYQKNIRKNFPELIKAQDKKRYYKHRDKILLQKKKHLEENREEINSLKRIRYKKNREKILLQDKKYKSSPKGRAKINKRVCEKLRTDPKFKLNSRIRSRIHEVLKAKGKRKALSSLEYLGVPNIDFLKRHLESQFKPGMNWQNNTIRGWHIDHIIPCSSFNFNDINEIKKCWHYTNLQPLWAIDNIRKSNKF